MRTLAIGDIHGCHASLTTLIREVHPASNDQVIFLGDYIDRGPASRLVMDWMVAEQNSYSATQVGKENHLWPQSTTFRPDQGFGICRVHRHWTCSWWMCQSQQVFSTAARMKSRLQSDAAKPFKVFTIADTLRAIRARGGLMVQPNFNIANHPAIDLFIVPGGVVTAELKRESIVGWIARTASKSSITASVCTGAFLLGKAGLLCGKTITTHWEDMDDFRSMFPDIPVQSERRWVDAGTIVTSGGISAGLDMSLHLVARLEGEELAVRTARQMDYDWQRSPR